MKRLAVILWLMPCLLYGQVSSSAWLNTTFLNFGADTLIQNPVRALVEDANDTLWAALGAGLAKQITATTFFHYLSPDSSFAPWSQNDVRDVSVNDDGTLWAATGAGLLKLPSAVWASRTLFTDANSFVLNNTPRRVQPDTSSSIWVGFGGSLNTAPTPVGFALFPDPNASRTDYTDSIPAPTVRALARDSSGNIWVGTDAGLAVFMGVWFEYDTDDGLPSNQVLSIGVDSTGLVWIGTSAGVVSFDGDTTWVDHSDSVDAHGGRAVFGIAHTSNPPYTFFATDSGIVTYKASQGFPYSPYGGYTKESTNDSLPSNRIYDLIVTGAGTTDTVWVATAAGLVRLIEVRE